MLVRACLARDVSCTDAPACTITSDGTPVSDFLGVLTFSVLCVALLSSCHSNDVRRFDDGISFWLFVWAGPLEAALVLMMVSLELGFVPAVCGMAAMLAVIPIQVRVLWLQNLQCMCIPLLKFIYPMIDRSMAGRR
jgi:hypothetical protein